MKKTEFEQLLEAYSEADIANDSNFKFIFKFRNTPNYQQLNDEAEITFEMLADIFQEIAELDEDYLFSKNAGAAIFRRLKYKNRVTFADETSIEELTTEDRIILDNYVFSVEELKNYAVFCSEKFNINPHLKDQNNLFSEIAWEKLKQNNILGSHVKQFESQKSLRLTPAMLDAIKHLLNRLLVEGKDKSHEIQQEFLIFKLSLTVFEQNSLDNYMICVPLINKGMQNMLFKDALVGGYPKCINIVQIFLWQSVLNHLPNTIIPDRIIVLAVAHQFRLHVAGQPLENSRIANAFNQQGIMYAEQGHYDMAIEYFTHSIKWDHNNCLPYTNLGIVYYRQKSFVLAIKNFNNAIALNHENTLAYLNRGFIFEQQGEIELAITDYSKAIALDYKSKFAYFHRGILYKQKNELNLAIADFKQCIVLDNENANPQYQLGLSYNLVNNQDLALKHFNQTIALNPKHADALYNRGMLYEKQNRHELAITDYSKAIKLNPNLKEANNAFRKLNDKIIIEAAFAERKSFRFLF